MQSLVKAKAFDTGSEMWVLPQFEACELTGRIDWYLNFQVKKLELCQPRQLPKKLQTLLQEHEWPEFQPEFSPKAPALFAPQNHFPTKAIAQVPFHGDFKAWVDHLIHIWRDMGGPSLRVFLPTGHNYTDLQKVWPKDSPQSISVVPG